MTDPAPEERRPRKEPKMMNRLTRKMAARRPEAAAKGLMDAGVVDETVTLRHPNTREVTGCAVIMSEPVHRAMCDAGWEGFRHYHDDNSSCEQPDCFECTAAYSDG